VQIFAMFETRGAPYVMDIDTTHEISRRLWPQWSPMSDSKADEIFARERRVYGRARHLFVRTGAVRDSMSDFYGVPAERITVTGGGVPLDQLPAVVLPAARREPVILFVGREWRRKGGDILLDAFRRVRSERPDVRLQIVGTDEPSAEAGVEVLGRIDDRERMDRLYAQAAVFCLPVRYDPYPGAVMEAMAFATPVVVSSTGGIIDIVDGGRAGSLVPPEDPGAVAGELLRLLADGEERDRIGRLGRDRITNDLHWDAVVDRWRPVLEDLAA
jgi:starch synthase